MILPACAITAWWCSMTITHYTCSCAFTDNNCGRSDGTTLDYTVYRRAKLQP